MAKKVVSKVPKKVGFYCVKGRPSASIRCMERYASGKVKIVKGGNIKCGCAKKSKKGKKR